MRSLGTTALGLALTGFMATAPGGALAMASFDITGSPLVDVGLAPTQHFCADFGLAADCSQDFGLGPLVDGSWYAGLPGTDPTFGETPDAVIQGQGTITSQFFGGAETGIAGFSGLPPSNSSYTENVPSGSVKNWGGGATENLIGGLEFNHQGSADDSGTRTVEVFAPAPLIWMTLENTGTTDFVVPWLAVPTIDLSAIADLGDVADVRSFLSILFQDGTGMTVSDVTYIKGYGATTLETANIFSNPTIGYNFAQFGSDLQIAADGTQTANTTGAEPIPYEAFFTTTLAPGSTANVVLEFTTVVTLETMENQDDAVVPLPAAFPLLGAGVGALAWMRRRRKAA